MTRLVFLVPAWNERASLPSVIADLRAHFAAADILVINDGSTDGTDAVAARLGVAVLNLPFNLGVGAAIQAGMMHAADAGYDVAVQFDGDGQHIADQVQRLLDGLQSADVVIGSRFMGQHEYRAPLLRAFGIGIFRFVNSLVLRRRFTDNTSGFRAYNRRAIRFLAHDYPHDYPEPESVITLCRHGFTVTEVPVTMRLRQEGKSSITLLRATYYMAKVVVAILIGAMREPREIEAPENPVRRPHEPAHSDSGDHR